MFLARAMLCGFLLAASNSDRPVQTWRLGRSHDPIRPFHPFNFRQSYLPTSVHRDNQYWLKPHYMYGEDADADGAALYNCQLLQLV